MVGPDDNPVLASVPVLAASVPETVVLLLVYVSNETWTVESMKLLSPLRYWSTCSQRFRSEKTHLRLRVQHDLSTRPVERWTHTHVPGINGLVSRRPCVSPSERPKSEEADGCAPVAFAAPRVDPSTEDISRLRRCNDHVGAIRDEVTR